MNQENTWSKELTMRIGQGVREMRNHLKLSAADLSKRTTMLGHTIPRNTITNLENGRKEGLPVHELLILADALEIPPAYLICYPDEQAGMYFAPNDEHYSGGRALMQLSGLLGLFSAPEGTRFEILSRSYHFAFEGFQWTANQAMIEGWRSQPWRLKYPEDRAISEIESLQKLADEHVQRATELQRKHPDEPYSSGFKDFDVLVKERLDSLSDNA